MVMTDMKLLMVETETADITADDVDTVFYSTDVGRSKQVDQNLDSFSSRQFRIFLKSSHSFYFHRWPDKRTLFNGF
uniref:Uncharacterized protein n=1 Tax=Tanacetum cinerariifolium TaxID=118510 RepID=A0A699SXT3_TANCI|nr:hypothetical protein [Tanacetum cinerariifolium]